MVKEKKRPTSSTGEQVSKRYARGGRVAAKKRAAAKKPTAKKVAAKKRTPKKK